MYPLNLEQITRQAIDRLYADLNQNTPFLADRISDWTNQLAGDAPPEAYFMHPLAFPALLLPWWAEQKLVGSATPALHAELIYSTINGYYYIRLIDNVMDGQATVEYSLLPALNFFHTQFQTAYQPYFPYDHPFWSFFKTTWFRSGEAAMEDASLLTLTETEFKQIAAQKICAAKIPVAAVCYRHERPDKIEIWAEFIDLFGCWHQFLNDLFDWHKDLTHHTGTYFLSEAERRRRPAEPVAGWVAREGFGWGVEKLQRWMLSLKRLVQEIDSPPLVAYLNTRETMLTTQAEQVQAGLQTVAKISRIVFR